MIQMGGGRLSPQLSSLLKFIACVVIALHHYAQNILVSGESNHVIWHILSAQGGYSGVALFFFLSGYGLSESENKHHLTFVSFIKKRFWKIYKPILIINTLHYIGIQASNYSQIKSWYDISLGSIFLIDNLDYYLWFVSILFVCYLLFAISCQIKDSLTKNLLLILGTAIAMVILWMCGVSVNHWISIPFFTIGVFFSVYNERIKILQANGLYWIAVIGVILMCGYMARINHLPMLIHLDINIIQTILLVFIVSKWNIIVPSFSISKLSYPIYLVHHKVIDVSLWLGHLMPIWLFVLMVLYFGWLLNKTNLMVDNILSMLTVTLKTNIIHHKQ